MQKKQEGPKEISAKLGGHEAKIIIENSGAQKKNDKLSAMRIALTYIEGQGMTKVTPKKAIEIADEFLKWLEK